MDAARIIHLQTSNSGTDGPNFKLSNNDIAPSGFGKEEPILGCISIDKTE